MVLDYKTYEEAKKAFRWSDRWDVFDRRPEELNIAYACVDRHPKQNVAIRLKKSDGSKETYTFKEFSSLTSQFARMLEKRGVGPGDYDQLSPSRIRIKDYRDRSIQEEIAADFGGGFRSSIY